MGDHIRCLYSKLENFGPTGVVPGQKSTDFPHAFIWAPWRLRNQRFLRLRNQRFLRLLEKFQSSSGTPNMAEIRFFEPHVAFRVLNRPLRPILSTLSAKKGKKGDFQKFCSAGYAPLGPIFFTFCGSRAPEFESISHRIAKIY